MPEQNDDHPSQEKLTRKAWVGALAVLLAAVSVALVVLTKGSSSEADPASARAVALTRSTRHC